MQNKPNLRKVQMAVTLVKTTNYNEHLPAYGGTNYSKQTQTNPILPAAACSPVARRIAFFIRLWRINFDFCILKCLTLFLIISCVKTSPAIQAQFKQFGAPFSAISRVFRVRFETIQA